MSYGIAGTRGPGPQFERLEPRLLLSAYVVNSAADPGDGVYDATEGTLREAIAAANANGGWDSISFNIPPSDPGYDPATGTFTIALASALPALTGPTQIDGYTQPGARANRSGAGEASDAILRIGLDGSKVSGDGLYVAGGGSTIRGLMIRRFDGAGVVLASGENVVKGNFIGTDHAGQPVAGNGAGVTVEGSSNTVGGTAAEARNLIGGNEGAGVAVLGESTGNAVLGNEIFANGGLGIDLGGVEGADGVTANDADDSDSGANGLQNYPVLTAATSGSGVGIIGSITSTPATPLRIELFANDSPDPSGYGEGRTYLGFIERTTDDGGYADILATLPANVAQGRLVTATATNLATGETSEFSGAVLVRAAGAPGEAFAIADETNTLGRVDPVTGQFDPIGVLRSADGSVIFDDVENLAIDPQTGLLYGIDGGSALLVIDSQTAVGTVVGDPGLADVDALAFGPLSGRLFAVDATYPTNPGELYEIDKDTGAATLVTPLTGPSPDPLVGTVDPHIDGIAFDPSTGVLFGVYSAWARPSYLVTIAPLTGQVTMVGAMGFDDVEGLSFAPGGTLYGVLGDSGAIGDASQGSFEGLVVIDTQTGQAAVVGPFGALPRGRWDVEALAFTALGPINPGFLLLDTGSSNDLKYDPQGNLHLAWFDYVYGRLVYSVQDVATGEWSPGLILDDSSAEVGRYVSMAIDNNGLPALAYYDAANADLKYAFFDGAVWWGETVHTNDKTGRYPSLAFDAQGRATIAYYKPSGGYLMLAEREETYWCITVVDGHEPESEDVGRFPSLKVNPATGRWAIAYADDTAGQFRYAEQTAQNTWARTTYDATTILAGGYLSLQFDANNLPCVSYYDAHQADLKFARFDGTTWILETVAQKRSQGLYTNLFFDSDDNANIVYWHKTANNLVLAKQDGAEWTFEVLIAGAGREAKIAVNPLQPLGEPGYLAGTWYLSAWGVLNVGIVA